MADWLPCSEATVLALESDGLSVGHRGFAGILPAPFESDQFGLKMGKVVAFSPTEDDGQSLLEDLVDAASVANYNHLSVRFPANQQGLLNLLERNGFLMVDGSVVLENRAMKTPLEGSVEAIRGYVPAHDHDSLCEVARSTLVLSRFLSDPWLDRQQGANLMATWCSNNLNGRADQSFVAVQHGRPVGFNTCLLHDRDAIIDLIAVGGDAQGNGFGSQLVAAALAHYSGRADRMLVGTQWSNLSAIRLYCRAGFIPCQSWLTFHILLS